MAQRLNEPVKHRASESLNKNQWLNDSVSQLINQSDESVSQWSSASLNHGFTESMNQRFEDSMKQWTINDAESIPTIGSMD